MLVVEQGGKQENLEKKPYERGLGRDKTTKPTHTWRHLQESNRVLCITTCLPATQKSYIYPKNIKKKLSSFLKRYYT